MGRTGGDEFVIILPNTSSTMAMHAAERIRTGVQALRIPDDEGKFISTTISLGVSSYRDGIKTVDQLIKEADQALYSSKGKAKNQSILFE